MPEHAMKITDELHPLSRHNRDRLRRSVLAGCFCCKAKFSADEVTEWTEAGQTACCPNCGTDAVIGDADAIISSVLLRTMYERWFNR